MKLTRMQWKIWLYTIAFLALASGIFAGQAAAPAPNKYVPSHEQYLELQVRQKDAQLAQVALQQAQRDFQLKLGDLTAEGDAIKKANKWPDGVQFNPNDLSYNEPPVPTPTPTPAPAPAAAKPEPKK